MKFKKHVYKQNYLKKVNNIWNNPWKIKKCGKINRVQGKDWNYFKILH